jgi:CBS-domain-containing membrane protein
MDQQRNPARKVLHRKLRYLHIAASSLASFGGIGLAGYLSLLTKAPLLVPSFGATCIIVTTTPSSSYAQPRSIVGGHFLASLVGLLCSIYFGYSWWSLALAVGLSAALMQLTRTLHPPAAADPLYFMMREGLSWQQLFMPIMLGSVLLVGWFFIIQKWLLRKDYPQYWF